jgi:predicted HTH domain antitoxin
MQITVQLPDDLAQRPNPGREALESLAIEGYRSGALSHFEAAQLLGMSRMEFDGFLKGRSIFDHAYSADDLAEDVRNFEELRASGKLNA